MLHMAIAAGLILGLLVGLGASATGNPFLLAVAEGSAPFGTLFMNAIRMVVIPLIMTVIFTSIARLDFEAPDEKRFPALALARQTLQTGGCAPTILNAANEVAVECFLNGDLAFLDIPDLVEKVLSKSNIERLESLEHVMVIDKKTRMDATNLATKY